MVKILHSVYSRKLDYLEAAINRGNQISGDCNVCVIVKLKSKTGVDVKDFVDKLFTEMTCSTGLVRKPWDREFYQPE